MTIIGWILQTLGAAGACWLLWRFLRQSKGEGQPAWSIVALGFLFRALAAQVLFWVSWLSLPAGRSLQIGNGLWFFAYDGWTYLDLAARLSESGWQHAAVFTPQFASPFFVWCLAVSSELVGHSAMTGVLLNLFAYVGVCRLIALLGARLTTDFAPVNLVLAAVSFSPAAMLWSLQPLKDPLFFFVLVLFLYALIRLAATWRERGSAGGWSWIALSILAAVSFFAIATTRWYVAAAVLVASVPFFLLLTIETRGRRLQTAAVSLVLIGTFSQLLASVGEIIPPSVLRVLRPWAISSVSSGGGLDAPSLLDPVRERFESLNASSAIGSATGEKADGGPTSSRNAVDYVLSGTIAAVVPQFVLRPLGVSAVSGNRAMIAFTDLDTLVFDFTLVLALWWTAAAWKRGVLRNPSFWLVLVTAGIIAFAVAYTVNNLGALIRYRSMVFSTLVLLPFVAAEMVPMQPAGEDEIGRRIEERSVTY